MISMIQRARRLGVVSSVILALGGWIFLLKDITGAFILSFGAVLILTLSLFKPVFLQVPAKMWLFFINIMIFVIANILFILLFFLIVTPIGLLGRIFDKLFLSQEIMSYSSSYWHKAPDTYWTTINKKKVNPMRW